MWQRNVYNTFQEPTVTSIIDVKKTTAWGESGFPSEFLDVAANKQLTYPEMLEQLRGAEVAARRERCLSTRTKMAHLPFQRTPDQFDFAFQPSIDERQVNELASLAFVA